MARALMSDPAMIMLDEPMAGVNPALTQSLLGHIEALRDQGTTVLFVEHDMHMVRHISDWVVVMAEGRIVAEGPPASLGAESSRYRVTWRAEDGELVTRETEDPTALLHQLTSAALARDERLQDLSVTRPTLEDVYLQLTAEVAQEATTGG
jgi:ABC-type multidrug transport system ATPase subunit